MNSLKFNMQLFATDLKSANTATYGKRMNETEAHAYYDRTLKDALYEEYTWGKYADTIKLPQNHGKSYHYRTSGKYVSTGQIYIEGVNPTEDEPMKTYEYEVRLNSHTGYITFTDELDLYSLDKGESTRLQRNQGKAVGEYFQNLVYNAVMSSRNRWFAGTTPTTGQTLTQIRANVKRFELDDFRKIKSFLKRQKVKPYAGGDYLVLVSPEVVADLMTLKKSASDGNYTYLELMKDYGNTKPLYEGEIGRFNGFRFVEDNTIKGIAEANGGAIHGCVIFGQYNGEKGLGVIELEGKGKPETILKPITSGGARENPVNSIGSIGWKCHGWATFIKYQEAVMIYECLSDVVADEVDVTTRDTFVKGYDENGDNIAKKDGIVNAGVVKLTGNILTLNASYNGKAVKNGVIHRFLVSGDSTSVITELKKDENLIQVYGVDGVVTFYSDASCETEYTGGTVSADTTIYVKTL